MKPVDGKGDGYRQEPRFPDQALEDETPVVEAFLPEQGKRHAQFLRAFPSLRVRFRREGATPEVLFAARLGFVEWFLRHIKREDRRFSLFLRTAVQQQT